MADTLPQPQPQPEEEAPADAGVVAAVRESLVGGLEDELEVLLYKAQSAQQAFDRLGELAVQFEKDIEKEEMEEEERAGNVEGVLESFTNAAGQLRARNSSRG